MSWGLLLAAGGCLLLARRLWNRQRALALAGLGLVLACSFGLAALTVRPTAAAQLSDTDLARILASGGFQGQGLVTGLEIVFAESGGRTDARNQNANGTVDRGIWQINSVHASVSDQCADDPVCATKFAFELSKQGSDWHDWTTYTSGAYQRFSARAHKAVNDVAPGCDLAWDPQCPVKLAWQGVVSARDAVPLAADSSGLPSLPMPGPSLDPTAWVMSTVNGVLWGWDQALQATFERLWNGMVVGEDDLGGGTRQGSFLIIDNQGLYKIWLFMSGLVFSSNLLVLALSAFALIYMLGGGAQHDLARLGLRFLASILLLAGSWFLITQLIAIDNGYVNTLSAHVAVELRNLPAYQGLKTTAPAPGQSVELMAQSGVLMAMVLLMSILMILLMVLFIVRTIVLWVLVAVSPIAAALFPFLPGIVGYYLRTLMGWIFLKAGMATVLMVFMLMGIHSPDALVNALVMDAAIVTIILVPSVMLGMLHWPWGVGAGVHAIAASPIRLAAGGVWNQIRHGQSAGEAKAAAQSAYYQAKAAQANASAARQNQLAEARARKANERAA